VLRWCTLDYANDEAVAIRVGAGEDANAWIGDAAAREVTLQSAPPQRSGEGIGQLAW
jgi:hypothetical protein